MWLLWCIEGAGVALLLGLMGWVAWRSRAAARDDAPQDATDGR